MLYIVVHDDVDGIGSHTICEIDANQKGIETEHIFANYQSVGSALKEIKKKFEEGDKLIIADIGYSDENFASFLSGKSQETFKGNFSWYDHHEWPDGVADDVSKLAEELVIDQSRCASEILKTRFLPDDDTARYLADIAGAHDFKGKGFDEDTYNRACKLQDVISSGYDKGEIVKLLSTGTRWNDVFENAYNGYQKTKADIFANMDEKTTVCDLYSGAVPVRLSIAYVPPGLESSKDVRKHLFENSESDVILAIWPEGSEGGSRVAYEVRDDVYEPIFEFMVNAFRGGGRSLAGGGTYRGSLNPEDYDLEFSGIVGAINSFTIDRYGA